MTTPTLPQAAQMAEDTLAALWDRHAGGKLNIDSACPAFIDRAQKTITALRKHTQLAGDRVTVNPRGRRNDKSWDTNKLADVWTRAHKGTGVTVRNPYQLRHTFASQLLSQGENPAYIAKLLGHKTTEMVTRTYGRWVSEGESLGFDRPPRRYGMEPLWAVNSKASQV